MEIQELYKDVSRLFQTGGQAQVEAAIAMWYLKKVDTANSRDENEDAADKACALDHHNAPLWLAQKHHRRNEFSAAAKYYLKTFQAEPTDRTRWQPIGDYLLRYGSAEQVVDFYAQIISIDSGNEDARFFLDCYADFDRLKQEVACRILCAGQTDRGPEKLLMQVVFWGPRYTDIFLNYFLPALCAPGNLPALPQELELHFVICTDRDGAVQLQNHRFFKEISKHVIPHVIEFSAPLFAYAQHVTAQKGGGWNIPSTLMTNAAHYAVLECGRRLGTDVLNFSPDHILSDRFMTEMIEHLTDDVHALAGPGFRLHDEPPLLEKIESRYRRDSGTLEVPPEQMVNLLVEYLPEANFVHAEQFSNYPIYLCWKVESEGIIAHVNHYHPWVVRGKGLGREVQLSLDPIDGRFLSRNLFDTGRIGFAPLAMLSFDLGKNPLCLPTESNRFNPRKVASWARPFLTTAHERYFRNPLYYSTSGTAHSTLWQRTAMAAEKQIAEIIADARAD